MLSINVALQTAANGGSTVQTSGTAMVPTQVTQHSAVHAKPAASFSNYGATTYSYAPRGTVWESSFQHPQYPVSSLLSAIISQSSTMSTTAANRPHYDMQQHAQQLPTVNLAVCPSCFTCHNTQHPQSGYQQHGNYLANYAMPMTNYGAAQPVTHYNVRVSFVSRSRVCR